MPELPEVETIRKSLSGRICGRKILNLKLTKPKLLRGQKVVEVKSRVINSKILAVDRRAKYLILRLNKGILVLHLGMTGQIFVASEKKMENRNAFKLPDKHTHFQLELSGGKFLYFRDTRQFGRVRFLENHEEHDYFKKLGPEPLGKQFKSDYLYQSIKKRKTVLKAVLLNQKVVAGLGNIYVDEACHAAKVSPCLPGKRINLMQARSLYRAIRNVLQTAVKYRGTSISDYRDPDNNQGGFQHRLRVYGRAGQKCKRCGSIIKKGVVAQRGTHWCAVCQKQIIGGNDEIK
ncbi:bifunctional DNA-formamidopyrimidine glycosylase/DNA-(apurinic or apyrimidinic site) lyase [bacterium]|nr:bifunctional DNA-formamidopyrimidine glycosylase/DNA-(apurinic or apyrimidinic site) lyase [bacterium]